MILSRLLAVASLVITCCAAHAQSTAIVINEINYADSGSDNPAEFVELYNAGTNTVDLSGWKFDSGITYTFPAGVTIASNAYVTISGNPTAFAARWGFTPLGPWNGKLANEGEQVRLRDAANTTIDSVMYGIGFPWPTGARKGSSMELIHPSLNNNIGGSWRSSGVPAAGGEPQVFVPPNDVSWRYRKGTSEASSPLSAWRQIEFVENATWLTGQTSIGYGDADDYTVLTDMQGQYSSLFLRRVFNINEGQVPAALKVKARVDDGCIVWINGTEVARFYVSPTLDPRHDSLAQNHDADVVAFDSVNVPNASAFLNVGSNVVAVQAFNSSQGSSDFTIDVSLEEALSTQSSAPTPGSINSCFATNAPPAIAQVTHSPEKPGSNQDVVVTASLSDTDGVDAVTLRYQVVEPGAYIRKTDSAYAATWEHVAMNDAGINGDAAAGDGIFSGIIPAHAQGHRRLVRYRVSATDLLGNQVEVPYSDDGSPNFAYFVYEGIPSWSGAFNPGFSPVITYPSNVLGSLPVYHLIANRTDVNNSQFSGGFNGQRFYGTLVYDGRVYDHVQFNNRGEASTYVTGKNKWRIHFNPTREFQARDNWGRPYEIPWDELNLNACASPWAAVHRGMAGVEEALSFRLYELLGLASPQTHFLHFRVIDDPSEASASQFQGGNPNGVNGGDLWGLYLAVEQPDGSFLDERGLEDGNIYKIESSNGDQKHQGDGQPSDGSDWIAFRTASGQTQTETWWKENMNMEAFYSFHAGNRLLGNVDLRIGFNHYFYHAPDGRWQVIPWDLDMMFIPKHHQGGLILQHNSLNDPVLRREFQNRARELLDLVASDSSTNGGQIGQLIHEYRSMVAPVGTTTNWAQLDAAMWNFNPRTQGNPDNHGGQTSHRGNFFWSPYTDSRIGGDWVRTLNPAGFEGLMRYLVDYATDTAPNPGAWAVNNGEPRGYGYEYVRSEAADALAPARPTATYVGAPGFVVNDLNFSSSGFSGSFAFAAVQWRIGRISAPGIPLHYSELPWIYEVTDVWRSPELTSNNVVVIPASALQLGHTYRARVRHKDISGRWSRWSDHVQFVATPAASTVTREKLVISEFMYNPPSITSAETAAGFTDKQLFEYVELLNISTNELDLSGLAFTTGITFQFPDGMKLAERERVLVVNNVEAFTFRYGTSAVIAGTFSGNLNNSSERLVLAHLGQTIHDFTYSDGSNPPESDPWPKAADGDGSSLVLMNPESAPDHDVATNWRASTGTGGAPGSYDPITYIEWARRFPGIGNGFDDADADGWSNEAEYVFGSSPTNAAAHPAELSVAIERLSINGSEDDYAIVQTRRSAEAGDVMFVVEFSSDLISWPTGGIHIETLSGTNSLLIERWRSPEPLSALDRSFSRARALLK